MDDITSGTGETLQDLTRPEHLLVWALRAIAIGHDDCPLLGQTFHRACGPLGSQAFGAYCMVVKTIGMMGRRRLKVHVPGCPCVSLDEKAIVGVIAAAQDSLAEGDEILLRMRLHFLVEREPAEPLVFAAQAVAKVFGAAGHRLPSQGMVQPTGALRRPSLVTVH